MPRGRKLASLTLTDEQQNQLQGMAQSATLPYALVVRARIILASAEGLTNTAVAKRVGVIPHTVGKWRRRFREAGMQGLQQAESDIAGTDGAHVDTLNAEDFHVYLAIRMGVRSLRAKVDWCDEALEQIERQRRPRAVAAGNATQAPKELRHG